MVDANTLEVGDLIKNPSQRSGAEYEVVDVYDEQTFDGTETVFDVKRSDHKDSTHTSPDTIYEKDHDRWEVVD